MAHLSPDPARGPAPKRRLVDHAIASLASVHPPEVRFARNLDLAALPEAQAFWKALASWARGGMWKLGSGAEVTRLLSAALAPDGAVEEWRTAIRAGAQAALADPSPELTGRLWELVAQAPVLIGQLLSLARRPEALETALVCRPPATLEQATADEVLPLAAKASAWRLFAMVAGAALKADDAVARLLAAGREDQGELMLALGRANTTERVAVALGRDVPGLDAIAGQAAAKDRRALERLKVGDPRWGAIWAAALREDATAWDAPKRAREAADAAFVSLGSDTTAWFGLASELAATPLADLSSHHDRAAIWARAPDQLRPRVLAATARGWIDAFPEHGTDTPVEEPLAAEILRTGVDHLLASLRQAPISGVALFRALPALEEAVFDAWMRTVIDAGALQDATSRDFGRLIAARNWGSAASTLSDIAFWKSRSDLRPALESCANMFGAVQRFWLGIGSEPTASTRWRILEEVGTELYPAGPDQSELWSRAGGKKGALPRGGTGGDAWRHVVGQAEKGAGEVDIGRLIDVMSSDFGNNPALRRMRSDPLFRGARK